MKKINYIRSFITDDIPLIADLSKNNEDRNDIQPPVEPEVGKLLGLMLRLIKPEKVLEIGTGNGYSTLWLAQALKENQKGHLITIDAKERLHIEAVENIKQAELFSYVDLIYGDAAEIVPTLSGEFDIIFQDCGKYLYPELFDITVRKLKPGGLLIADDTLFKVNDTVRENLGRFTHEYNQMVFADKRLYSTILPAGHGITISYKVEN